MQQNYAYVGPPEIAAKAVGSPGGRRINSYGELNTWIAGQGPEVTATFVVACDGTLRLADRRSEHVACAQGEPVLAAGEITLAAVDGRFAVTWITNQSTGYCPEPDCWPAVKTALQRAGLDPPQEFSRAFEFRRCTQCNAVNIIKDVVFRCEVCRANLSLEWNLKKSG